MKLLCKILGHRKYPVFSVEIKSSMVFSSHSQARSICKCSRCGRWVVPVAVYEAIIEGHGVQRLNDFMEIVNRTPLPSPDQVKAAIEALI